MKLSYNWLKRYIDIDLDPQALSTILTDIGLEVEGLDEVETIKGGLKGVLVGHVEECTKHPNADKLSLTKVNIGDLELKQIICGAPNVAAGQKVLIATIGTVLYDDKGESFKIKKGKIRGELSEGMICAEDELGLGDNHDGIMVLPEDVPVGTQASDYFQVESDYVFDIGLTPNRSDATSHLGVARDLGAYLKINQGWTGTIKDPDLSAFKVDENQSALKITVEDAAACPRYSGVSISDITIKPSPKWMQDLLTAIGVRPISNVVDITNFILHEYGQPLHAFDAKKIGGQEIIVKKLPEGTPFLSLDEKERKLHPQDLMICDGSSAPMCIGGVFGGLTSGVSDSTTDIFLEAAHFDPGHIRRSSTRHLLRTDAAQVFEKGSDPAITIQALERAALLLKEHAGAKVTSEIVDIYPEPIERKAIHLNYSTVTAAIGTELTQEEMHDILRAMDMELKPVDDNSLLVMVPTDKADVTREVDLIEEILRIYGFNKVPIPSRLNAAITYQNYPTRRQVLNKLADFLADNGFNEMMGMSLIESARYESVDEAVAINNTSNIHLDIMRPDALVSGLKSVAHNLNYKQNHLKLFEIGKSYKTKEEGFDERGFLSMYMTGSTPDSWQAKGKSADFYELKKWVELLLSKAKLSGYQTKEVAAPFDYGLEYHRGPSTLVRLGSVQRSILKKAGISVPVFYAEFSLKALLKGGQKSNLQVEEISKLPSVERDLSLVLPKRVAFSEVLRIAKATDKKLMKDVSLFDVYENEAQLGEGKKAYAVKFRFQDMNKTLKDKEVEKVMSALQKNFEEKLGAEIRS